MENIIARNQLRCSWLCPAGNAQFVEFVIFTARVFCLSDGVNGLPFNGFEFRRCNPINLFKVGIIPT